MNYTRLFAPVLILLWLCSPTFLGAESVHEAWVLRHDGANHGADIPIGVVADAAGNVVVTGQVAVATGNADFYTAKYAPDGSVIWEVSYNGPGSGHDLPGAIALDSVGNVLVTGSSVNSSGNPDIYTVKYAALTGAVLWEKRYNGAASDSDAGSAIAVDGADNVIVTGYCTESLAGLGGGGFDYCTIKYAAADGQQVWVKTYNGTGNGSDTTRAVAVDAANNVMITGVSQGTGSSGDFYTVKYSAANGTILWSQRFDGAAHGYDQGNALALDGTGHLFVTGLFFNGSHFDYITLQYDAAAGTPGWTRQEDGTAHGFDSAAAVVVDATNNIIVTGNATGTGTGNDFLTVKYAPDGTRLWGMVYSGPGNSDDQGRGLSVDAAGGIVVSGPAWNGTNSDFFTVKYDGAGVVQWSQIYDGPAQSTDLVIGRHARTPDGGVVITGDSFGANNYDFVTVKYAPDVAALPLVTTTAADSILSGGATLHASITANYADATTFFDYGPDTSYGSSISGAPATVTGGTATPVSASITGLAPNTMYHFRARAVNSVGPTLGTDLTFTTANAPVINTHPSSATPAFGGTITLSASVTAEPGATYVWTRGGTVIINGGRYSGAGTATLTITGANIGDNGLYILTVTDGTGSAATNPATIAVTQNGTDRDPATASLGSNSTVGSILHLPDGRTLVGGNLTGAAATSTTSRLSIVQTNYQVTSTPVGTFDGTPSRLVRQPDGKILVLGPFTTIGGTSGVGRTYLARLNADLTLDVTFAPPIPNNITTAAALDDQGRIYLGGSFTQLGSNPNANYFVRLLPNGTLDTTFSITVNSGVTDIVTQADGKIIVGGNFSVAGPVGSTAAVKGIIRLLSTGAYDSGFSAAFSTPSGTLLTGIKDLALDSQQRILASAYHLGAAVPNDVFRLLSSGAEDPNFNFTMILNNFASVLEPVAGDKVLVGGGFTTTVNSYFRLNSDGSSDTAFTASLGTGFGASAASLLAFAHDALGRLWIGGNFVTYKSTTVNRLLIVQGEQPPSLAFSSQPIGSTAALASTATFTASAAGNNGFTFQWLRNGSPMSDGGRFSGTTTGTLAISAVESGDEAAYSVVVSSPGLTSITSQAANLDVLGIPEITLDPAAQTVDFGGSVTLTGAATGAATLSYLWHYNGNPLSNGTGVSGATTNTLTLTNIDFNDAGHYTLKAINGFGNDFSAGAILTVQKRPGVIVAGNLPTFVGVGYGGYVSAIQPLSDGSYIVGGAFDRVTINGVNTTRKGIARIKADGTLDMNFPTVNSANNPLVHAIAVDSTGRIFIAGDFTHVVVGATETPRLRVARLTSAFALDTAFNTSTVGPDKIVRALATPGDGSVYIGGDFYNIGTTAIRYMAKLNASGARDAGFTNPINTSLSETNPDNSKYVNSIVRLANGTLYVGSSVSFWGAFAAGQPAGRLVKLSASGARDFGFASPDAGTIINAIIALPDGSLFAGGNPVTSLKRRNGTTGADLGFALAGHSIQTYALHRQADGKLLSGSYGVLKRTDANLAVDTGFDVGTGFNGYIRAITTDSAGRIYVGGEFGTFKDQPCNRFIILNGGDLDSRTQPKPGQTITFDDIANRAFVPGNVAANTFTITLPTSSSGLPVTTVVSVGPAILVGNKLTITGAGTVMLTATQAGNDDFSPASIGESFQVAKASQTLTFEPMADRPAGTAPFLLSASLTSGLPVVYNIVNGPATVNGNVLTLTGATGFVSIQASHPGNADFLPASPDISRSFQVFAGPASPLPQTIVFNPLSPRSANELPFLVSASSTSGLPVTLAVTSGQTIASISGNLVTLSGPVGNVTITATQAGNASFLAAKAVTQTFKVNAAATTMTLTNLIQTYDGTQKSIGVVGGTADTIYYTVNKIKGTTPPIAVGSYAVEAVSGAGASAIKKAGSLVINKAPLLVVADDKRKFTGQDNPALTFAYSGFLGGDNAVNALTKAPAVTTTATKTSPGGIYPIKPAGGAATNYAFVYVNGSMKVESWAGQYEALLEDPVTFLPVGKLEITVLANSTGFTGKFTTAKQTAAVPLKGDLTLHIASEDADGTATSTIGTGTTAAKYVFTFNLPLDGDFTASVTRAIGTPAGAAANFGSANDGKKLVFPTGTPPVGFAGAHTVVFMPDSSVHALPRPLGYGHATAVIDAKGKLMLAGTLADGTKITASLFPDADAGYRLYLQPYTGRLDSYCAAWIELQEHPDFTERGIIRASDMQDLYWAKAAKTADANYRGGIPESVCTILLDPWLPPVAAKTPNPAITLAQRLFLNGTGDMDVLYDGLPGALNLTGLPFQVNMDAAGKVNVPVTNPVNPRAWKVTVTPATGAFTGSHTGLDATKPVTVNFTGVMRQPPSTETSPELIGAGFSIVPQLTGQTAGTTSTAISFERPSLPPD